MTVLLRVEKSHTDIDKIAKKSTLENMKEFIQKEIIENSKPMYVVDILNRFNLCFASEGGNDHALSSVQTLSNKLRKMFDPKTLTIKADSTKKMIVFKTGIPENEARKIAAVDKQSIDTTFGNCAMEMRRQILQLESNPLEEPLSANSIMKGEVEIPSIVTNFFRTLYTGAVKTKSNRKERLVESTSAVVVYSCSGGKLLPGKHLSLAIGLKSMSGSKQIVSLLNRFGHCASNEKVRRVDIGLESTITENSELLPEVIKKVTTKSLGTGLAWDNFDINLETLSGANSIHHTFGICYQEIQEDNILQHNSEAAASGSRKRRIKDIFHINESKVQDDVPSYVKKPRMNEFEFENIRVFPSESLVKAIDLDNIWEILINNFDGIPLWTGWNSKRANQSKTTHHQVRYMRPIAFPPTRIDVIRGNGKVR